MRRLDERHQVANAGVTATVDTIADAAFALVATTVQRRIIPGAALGVVFADGTQAIRHAGYTALLPEPEPLRADTPFDLASLTKVLLTTYRVLRLVEQGRVDLDDALAVHLPDLRQYEPGHFVRALTLRDCLAHRSGLPAVEPFYSWGAEPHTLKALVLQRDWPRGPPVYSDINFILLGLLVERLESAPLATLTPSDFLASPDAAATEHCRWRDRMLRGEVHDENAAALGGLAGHAGLFGNVAAVLAQALAILQRRWLSGAALDAMARSHSRPPGVPRGLGWELPHDGWSGGSLCTPQAIGHLGFTGTGLWIDPGRGVSWTLLTNRVHPSRHVETGISALRRAVSNIVCANV